MRFAPPAPDPLLLPRPRLEAALSSGLSHRLTLLKAPAGFGKSALLSALATGAWDGRPLGHRQPLAWYRLTGRDADPAIFLEGLATAVSRILPGFGRTVRAALRTTNDARGEFPRLMALFADELRESGAGVVGIVLEDLHHIRGRTVFDALEKTLLDGSSPLRLVVSTQSDPGFYLSLLRSSDNLVEIGEQDLRFTEDEVAGLLRRRLGRQPLPATVDEVVRQTGGWPSAVRLAVAIAVREGGTFPFRRLAPTLHGYSRLLSDLLSRLPPEARYAVLRSSLLARLEPRALEEAIGVRSPVRLMSMIEETGIPVVRVAAGDPVFEFEPLVRATLRQLLEEQLVPGGLAALQCRVAGYYAASGEPDEAIGLYLDAGDLDAAARTVGQFATGELARGHADLVLGWLRLLPNSVRQQRADLLVEEARLLLGRQKLNDARVLLVGAEQAVGRGEERTMSLLSAGWAKLRLLEGRHSESLASASEALGLVPPEDWAERAELNALAAETRAALGDLGGGFASAARSLMDAELSGDQLVVVGAMLRLGRLAQLRGSYTQALALLGRAVQRSRLVETELVTLSHAAGEAAAIFLDRGERKEAARVASLARKAGLKLRDNAAQARAALVTALAMQQMGQVEAAFSSMARGLRMAETLPPRAPERFVAIQTHAASMLRDGKRPQGLARAREALRVASSLAVRPLVEQCELMVSFGGSPWRPSPSSLLRLRRLCKALRRTDSRRWLSGGLALIAQGYARLGLRWLAASNLRGALALAQEESYIGAPLGLPLDAPRLLGVAVREGVAPEVAGTLLGVEPEAGERVLAPWLGHKRPAIRARAEQALKGLETGAGRTGEALLPWPGTDGGGAAGEGRGAPQAAPVELVALGGFKPVVAGREVEWPSTDARDLAAYLVVNRSRMIPRDRLFGELWPGSSAEDANVHLHVALYALRAALGAGYPPVDLELEARGIYRWNGLPELIDVERFRALLRRAAEAGDAAIHPQLTGESLRALEEAVGLYQGEFLAGQSCRWCLAVREELRSLLLSATRLLMDHYMALKQWEDAVRHGLKSLASDPLQEDVVRDLMLCYFRLGKRDAVLWQYREVKRLLARDRGAWPSEETRQLRVRLLGR